MRKKTLVATLVGLASLAMVAAALPGANSTVNADIGVLAWDGVSAYPEFSDEPVTFTKATETGDYASSPAIIVNFTFPPGVVVTDAAVDTTDSTCSDDVGFVSIKSGGSTVAVSRISCSDTESLEIDVDGYSTITDGDEWYRLSSEFKVEASRRKSPHNADYINMWQAIDEEGVYVCDTAC